MCSDSYLLEEAKHNPNAELAIVLAERLEEVQAEFDEKIEGYIDRIEDLEREINELTEDTYIAEGTKA
jgi:uncharacterized protein (UPF0335 family)